MFQVKAKKSFGQHFLKDNEIANRIASTLDGYPTLPVLEVGAGTGMLTKHLIEKEKDLTVVEIDYESIAYLKEHFPQLKGRIVQHDFLKLDLSKIYNGNFCIIGNYPYNISS
ncbi:MAG: methyltransferase domain-containing protein, partial [Bacteroidales bacterium]|nr:methyltransferase domain-containing protein [Bacteroidales bacterium]